MSPGGRGLVLGGGLAGMLAAAILTAQLGEVTVIERDRLPHGPRHRPGVPQAHHGHQLLPAGVAALEALLPGSTRRLRRAGARWVSLPSGTVTLGDYGWLPRQAGGAPAMLASRALLDWAVRDQVTRLPGVNVVTRTEVMGLTGDHGRVTGTLVRDRESGTKRHCRADLVIDATGRASRTPDWLRALGWPGAYEERVDAGVAYATRLSLPPWEGRTPLPVVALQGGPQPTRPGRAGVVFPIEGGQWLVTLSGTRGAEPPVDPAGFLRFARTLPHPLLAELITASAALDRPRGYRHTMNRWRHYERMRNWPDGLVVVGDALATTNPTHGLGMTVALRGLCALRDELARSGLRHGMAGRAQRQVARPVSAAWTLAAGQDLLHPGAVGGGSRRAAALRQRFGGRLVRAARGRPDVMAALVAAGTLSSPGWRLLAPRVVFALLRGPAAGPLTEPPFTSEEIAVLNSWR